jgi:hypothetical protein
MKKSKFEKEVELVFEEGINNHIPFHTIYINFMKLIERDYFKKEEQKEKMLEIYDKYIENVLIKVFNIIKENSVHNLGFYKIREDVFNKILQEGLNYKSVANEEK